MSRPTGDQTGNAAGLPVSKTQVLADCGAGLLDRFSRYAAIHTTSNAHNEQSPSSPGQWDLARQLVAELEQLGLAEVALSEACYVTARLPGNLPPDPPVQPLCFCAHLDTSPDCPGKDVRVLVHRAWDGRPISLAGGLVLDPATDGALARYAGDDIITSDGTTLLGADDKAGIAEIMTALAWLADHPEFPRPEVEVLFTPDEEIGRGTAKLPGGVLRSRFAFTMDGEDEGTYNNECFNGWAADVVFTGRMIHPGLARGRMVNPVSMAAAFIANLPRSESPEATDGPWGYWCAQEIHGSLEEVRLHLIVRDFTADGMERRLDFLGRNASLVEAAFPGGSVKVTSRKQYLNLHTGMAAFPWLEPLMAAAFTDAGLIPRAERIRGGTDGARLTEMGLVTPNIFAGGHNFHALNEWVPLGSLAAATAVIINLVRRWSRRDS